MLRGSDSVHGFFRCWTRKEAILKAEGTGLNIDLASFDVTVANGVPAALLHFRPASNLTCHWHLHHLEPADGVVGALATARDALVECFHLVALTQ